MLIAAKRRVPRAVAKGRELSATRQKLPSRPPRAPVSRPPEEGQLHETATCSKLQEGGGYSLIRRGWVGVAMVVRTNPAVTTLQLGGLEGR